MTGSVTSVPYYSYLNQLQGVQDSATTPVAASTPAATPAATPVAHTSSSGSAAASSANSANNSAASSLVSSLLGNGASSFSSQVLSLLQENNSGSFDPITSLLGGTSTNDPLTSIFANLFASNAAASLTQAQDNNSPQPTASQPARSNPINNLINAQTQASVAYNQTVLQNAQNVAAANNYQADGVSPLVA